MSVIANGNTYLPSADGKIYGQYPNGNAPVGGSGEFPYDSSRVIGSSPKYVASAGGNDGNDGSITSPWATVNYALQQLTAGDTLYLRGGTHYVTNLDFKFASEAGTALTPIEVTSYPGEEPVIDCSGGTWLSRFDNKDYWTFSHLKFTNYVTGIDIGEDSASDNFTMYSCEGETALGGDNVGLLKIRKSVPFLVDRVKCTLTVDPSTVHQNTGGLYYNERFDGPLASGVFDHLEMRNFRSGIYFKHGTHNTTSHTANTVVRNSFFSGNIRNDVGYNLANVHIENCILLNGHRLAEDDGGAAGDWNFYDHCTIFGGVSLSNQTRGSVPTDANPGAKNNKFQDCIIMSGFNVQTLANATADSDYNLFEPNIITHSATSLDPLTGTSVDLEGWKTFNNSDANSVEGLPTFVGGVSPTTIADFALAAGSAGKNASSTGTDMGADVTLVGVEA